MTQYTKEVIVAVVVGVVSLAVVAFFVCLPLIAKYNPFGFM